MGLFLFPYLPLPFTFYLFYIFFTFFSFLLDFLISNAYIYDIIIVIDIL